MRRLIFLLLFSIPTTFVFAQELGEIVPPKPPMTFPPNALGIDLMVGESGFGLGGFYKKQLSTKFTLFGDISTSEAKDEREIEYVDIYGQTFTIGKKNRVFLFPLILGAQYRMFENQLADNLRPYIFAGAGPTIAITTPYDKEFFNAFSYAQTHYAVGGSAGIGANFGLDKNSLIGLTISYSYTQFIDDGVEILYGRYKKEITSFFITLNFGFMY
jgi:hypothetical protein